MTMSLHIKIYLRYYVCSLYTVLDSTGNPIACGLLSQIESDTTASSDVYTAEAGPVGGSGITGEVTLYVGFTNSNEICFYGTATGFTGPQACTGTGCGTAVHEGESCASPQGRYFTLTANVPSDPWEGIGYASTQGTQPAEFVHCVRTGVSSPAVVDLPFLITDVNGNTVACGPIVQDIAPSAPPTFAPSAAPTTAAPTATLAPTSSTDSPTSSTASPTVQGATQPPSGGGGGSSATLSYTTVSYFAMSMIGALVTLFVY
jgi:hypothetical protein